MSLGIRNDEPARVDQLDRGKAAKALANAALRCETPLVVGLYGTWGSGKTSLMQLVKQELDASNQCLTVWFDAWQHQFDENPAIALLHTMVDELRLGEEGRKLLFVIAGALTNAALKATTIFSTKDLRELEDQYEEERFLVREKQVRLRKHFAALLSRATDDGDIRLVFFIDDLDRCVPDHILKVLEALKLFLNLPGCVYVLGVDRAALESSITHRYGNGDISEAQYLDKIVQVPFTLPPVPPAATEGFVRSLLPEGLLGAAGMIVGNLGGNPRKIKRFVNSFILNHEMARLTLNQAEYDPELLLTLLLVQYSRPEFYKELVEDRAALELGGDDETTKLLREDRAVARLRDLVARDPRALDSYIHLSEVVGVRRIEFDLVLTELGERKIQVLKVVREHLAGLGLADAKAMVEAPPPAILATGLTREAAEAFRQGMVEAGAVVEIR